VLAVLPLIPSLFNNLYATRRLSGNDPIDGCSKRANTIYNVTPIKHVQRGAFRLGLGRYALAHVLPTVTDSFVDRRPTDPDWIPRKHSALPSRRTRKIRKPAQAPTPREP
jgi:hypothetical protein